jgi:hypothetical protein
MANWLRYCGPGYYVLLALWVTGLIDIIVNLVAPHLHHRLSFGGAEILYAIPIGLLTLFGLILWLRLKFAGDFAGYYVLFALWVTGVIDQILKLIAPHQHDTLLFGRVGILFIPVGVITIFSFILWLIWGKFEKPTDEISGSSVG